MDRDQKVEYVNGMLTRYGVKIVGVAAEVENVFDITIPSSIEPKLQWTEDEFSNFHKEVVEIVFKFDLVDAEEYLKMGEELCIKYGMRRVEA